MTAHRDIFAELQEGFQARARQREGQTRLPSFKVETDDSELERRMIFLSAQLSEAHLAENLAMDASDEPQAATNRLRSCRCAYEASGVTKVARFVTPNRSGGSRIRVVQTFLNELHDSRETCLWPENHLNIITILH